MSEDEEKYPKKLVSRGVAKKSINHYCALKKIVLMRSSIGGDAYDAIEEHSQVGCIVKLAGIGFTWASKYVQQLLCNMLNISKPSELWVLADGQPIRFSLHEFEYITKLNCGLRDPNDGEVASGELWSKMGLHPGDGPNWAELEGVLKKCRDWSLEKRKMVGLLVVLHVGIFGLHGNSRIPFYHAKLVMDPERFERHPWGRVAYEALFRSIPAPALQGSKFTLHGLVHVLLIWAYEHIPQLGKLCGGKRDGAIPLLQWAGRNGRGYDLEGVYKFEKDIYAVNKVSS